VEPFEGYVHRVFFGSLALVLIPVGTLILAGLDTCARGVALGGAASLVNLVVMAFGIRRHAGATKRLRVTASAGNYSLRMGTIVAALLYAAANDRISLLATMPALFCVQVVLLLGGLTGWLEGPD
jgi:hypothetical protein